MKIQLSDHFTYGKLFRFTLPSVVMMIFTSLYGVVDGLFVSNFAGETAFAAVNFTMPFLMVLSTVGFMFGSGGGALIAKTLGEGKPEEANGLFSLFVYAPAVIGAVLAVASFLGMRPVLTLMGAAGNLLENCVLYGRVIIAALPFFILQMAFQSYFITAEKAGMGLWMTVATGVANMALDALFVAVFHWGIAGAAAATAASQVLGGVVPLAYFGRPNSSLLRLGSAKRSARALRKAVTNGASELVSNLGTSLISMLYNIRLLQYAGEYGVSAYGVLMYVNMIFLAIFYGYSIGVAPVVSYHYGAQNHPELKNLLRKSILLMAVTSVAMLALSRALALPLSGIFVGYNGELLALTLRAFSIFSYSFLFAGGGIFGSAFFTALNDGGVSAAISLLRTVVFQVGAVLLLPLLWGIDGIWVSTVAAELAACAVAAAFIAAKRRVYRY